MRLRGPCWMTPPITIALFVDAAGGDWHARRLRRSFEARGAHVVVGCLAACAFDSEQPSGLSLPGFSGGVLPDAAFVRSISNGSLEQITFRLGILHALEASGVRVWNRPTAIERAVDKSSATFLFQRAGLPVPHTVTVESRERAECALASVGVPAVSKPMFGAQGAGIVRIDGADGLPPATDVGDVYYMQRLIETTGREQPSPSARINGVGMNGAGLNGGANGIESRLIRAAATYEDATYEAATYDDEGLTDVAPSDETATYVAPTYVDWRVLVSAGRVVSAMSRRSSSWITNVHQGGTPSAVDPDPEMASLALRAASAVGVDYGGVDLIRDADGRLLVLEVNSNPAWRGLQSVTPFDIGDRLAADLLAEITARSLATGGTVTNRLGPDQRAAEQLVAGIQPIRGGQP